MRFVLIVTLLIEVLFFNTMNFDAARLVGRYLRTGILYLQRRKLIKRMHDFVGDE